MGFFDFIGDAVSGVADAASSVVSDVLGSPVGSVLADVFGGPAGFFLTPQGQGVAHALTGALGIPDPLYGGLLKKKTAPRGRVPPKVAPSRKPPVRRPPLRGKVALRAPAARQTVTLRQSFAPVASGLASLANTVRRAPQAASPSAAQVQAFVVQAIKKGIAGQGLSPQENAAFTGWKTNTAQGRSYVAQQQAAMKARLAAAGFVGPGHAPIGPRGRNVNPIVVSDFLSDAGGSSLFDSRSFVGPGGPPPRGDTGISSTIFDAPSGGGGAAPVGDSGPRLGGGSIVLQDGSVAYIPKAAGGRISLDAFDGGSSDNLPFDLARPEAGHTPKKRNAAALHSATWREKRRRQRRRRRLLPLDGSTVNTHPAIPVRRRN